MEGAYIMEFILLFVVFFFAPSLVAWQRKHNNRAPIILMNILLGWTVIGWVIAIIWAWTDNVDPRSWKEIYEESINKRESF